MGKLQELNKRDYNHISGGVQSKKKKKERNKRKRNKDKQNIWCGKKC